MNKKKWIFDKKYIVFYFGLNFEISFELCGYFDNRPRLNLNLFFFRLCIIFPFKNKFTDECDPPKWGIAYHNQILWIYRGGGGNNNGGNKWWTFYVPWKLEWVRTSHLRKDNTWEHETNDDRKMFWLPFWDEVIWAEKHQYKYTLKSGEVQEVTATIKLTEREWRWYWFKWLPLTQKIVRSIDVNFDKEVGEKSGTWKGGVTGCGYELLPDETPLECLIRMEKERKF